MGAPQSKGIRGRSSTLPRSYIVHTTWSKITVHVDIPVPSIHVYYICTNIHVINITIQS